ncbi:hypothetical protein J437_LFUL006866 [Ladona fulva]|uniref:Uncharacterized protein n=1 Tax=Ladona fulva TaxID=123851 RepID=A0A8K0KGE5_LADFU|nr:hypothetical protein J437_LFUL006866 [Ladona fulva]
MVLSWTPLHEACNRGWENVAKSLLNAGASVDARGLDDETPLHDAAVNGHVNVSPLRISSGQMSSLHPDNSFPRCFSLPLILPEQQNHPFSPNTLSSAVFCLRLIFQMLISA